MTKFIRSIAVLASVLGVGAVLAGGAAAAGKKTVHVRNTLIGAEVGGGENVFDIHGSTRGAAVQVVKPNASGAGGTYTSSSYFGTGTVVAVGQYTISPPDKNGIIAIHGKGRWVRGTGLFKHVSGKFTTSGTLDTKDGHLKVVLVGTQTY